MSLTKKFLSYEDEQQIVDAIAIAEKNTSGEIRVHLEDHTEKPPLERAKEVFEFLNMHKTAARNGVLFYVGISDHTFAIIGDEGIDKVVNDDFWNSTKDLIISHFKKQEFTVGLVEGVLKAGEQLKSHFPYQQDDENELSNEISRG